MKNDYVIFLIKFINDDDDVMMREIDSFLFLFQFFLFYSFITPSIADLVSFPLPCPSPILFFPLLFFLPFLLHLSPLLLFPSFFSSCSFF